jgi:hypothetical protein
MCLLMCYKAALLSEFLITHITSITALTTVYALMIYEVAPCSEQHITHHKCNGVHQYVCADVLLDCSLQ